MIQCRTKERERVNKGAYFQFLEMHSCRNLEDLKAEFRAWAFLLEKVCIRGGENGEGLRHTI